MQYRQTTRTYLQQQIEQADSFQQTLMLFDGAVRFLTQAKEAIAAGDIQARHNANRRAVEIVTYLMGMFDPATGGEAAKSLYRIFMGLLQKLSRVDFDNDAAVCDEVIRHLRVLRENLAKTSSEMQATARPEARHAAEKPNDPVGGPVRRHAVA